MTTVQHEERPLAFEKAANFSEYDFAKDIATGNCSRSGAEQRTSSSSVGYSPSDSSTVSPPTVDVGEDSFFVKPHVSCSAQDGREAAGTSLTNAAVETQTEGIEPTPFRCDAAHESGNDSPVLTGQLTSSPRQRCSHRVHLSPLLEPARTHTPSVPRTNDNLGIITAFLEEAALQPCRPLLTVFSAPLSVPSEEEYHLRMSANLLYFAKNYTNCAICVALLVCLWCPSFTLLVLFVAATRVVNHMRAEPRSTAVVRKCAPLSSLMRCLPKPRELQLLRTLQFVTCVLLLNYVGVLVVLGTALAFVVPVGAHALLLPCSDAAYANYVAFMGKRNIPVTAPRSPTQDLAYVDPSFEAALATYPYSTSSSPVQLAE